MLNRRIDVHVHIKCPIIVAETFSPLSCSSLHNSNRLTRFIFFTRLSLVPLGLTDTRKTANMEESAASIHVIITSPTWNLTTNYFSIGFSRSLCLFRSACGLVDCLAGDEWMRFLLCLTVPGNYNQLSCSCHQKRVHVQVLPFPLFAGLLWLKLIDLDAHKASSGIWKPFQVLAQREDSLRDRA